MHMLLQRTKRKCIRHCQFPADACVIAWKHVKYHRSHHAFLQTVLREVKYTICTWSGCNRLPVLIFLLRKSPHHRNTDLYDIHSVPYTICIRRSISVSLIFCRYKMLDRAFTPFAGILLSGWCLLTSFHCIARISSRIWR